MYVSQLPSHGFISLRHGQISQAAHGLHDFIQWRQAIDIADHQHQKDPFAQLAQGLAHLCQTIIIGLGQQSPIPLRNQCGGDRVLGLLFQPRSKLWLSVYFSTQGAGPLHHGLQYNGLAHTIRGFSDKGERQVECLV